MHKTNETNKLPAPISLTLDEARQVAAGTVSAQLASLSTQVMPWWWFGRPADISVVSQTINPAVNVAAGARVAFGV